MEWSRDGLDWPNHVTSRFVEAGGLRWHVQTAGTGPAVLLVHGTAASTHSWRDVLPLLAQRYSVVAADLPGHGFTSAPRSAHGWTLPGMAGAVADLLRVLDVEPQVTVGHSAGAAILVRAALDGRIAPRHIVSINGALLPFHGVGRHLFPTMARLMFLNPVMPALFAWRASHGGVVDDLIESTGSHIDAAGLVFYRRLMADRGHVGAALSMMASWDLDALERLLPRLATPLTLVVGSKDKAIPPRDADRVRELLPGSAVRVLAGLGHLAHEERPKDVVQVIDEVASTAPARAGGIHQN